MSLTAGDLTSENPIQTLVRLNVETKGDHMLLKEKTNKLKNLINLM